MSNTTLTAIDGLLAGHATDDRNHTGCTAILCPQGFTPGIAVPGFAPGCRETELMRPESQVDTVHGLLLAGGSAFGLAAADGVMRFLREQGHGFAMPHGVIPIVPGAVIYDLDMNARPGVLPDADMGYAAARAASAAPLLWGQPAGPAAAACSAFARMQRANRWIFRTRAVWAACAWNGRAYGWRPWWSSMRWAMSTMPGGTFWPAGASLTARLCPMRRLWTLWPDRSLPAIPCSP